MADKDKFPGADAFGAAFDEAVSTDKELASAPAGDKMPDDSADVAPTPKVSESVTMLQEAAAKAKDEADSEFSKGYNETKDVEPPMGDKPQFASFRQAFAWHRANGDKSFRWTDKQGRTSNYSTDLAPAKRAAKGEDYGNEGKRMAPVKAETKTETKTETKKASLYDTSRDPLVQKVKAAASSVASKTGADAQAKMPEPQRRGLPMSTNKPLSMEGVDPKTMLPRKG